MLGKKRLTALDLLRGFFLVVIIIDHVELFPSLLDLVSGRGRMFVSAAEGFFFISGLLVSYIYRKKLAQGIVPIAKKMWQRAAQLYVWAVAFTLTFTYWAVASGHTWVKYGLPVDIHWPSIVAKTLLLQYSFGWADFLPHYVVFMFFAPLVFWLLMRGYWKSVIVGSVVLWCLRGQNFVLAWQTIFVGGMIVGYYWTSLARWANTLSKRTKSVAWRAVSTIAIATFIFSYASVYILSLLNAYESRLPTFVAPLTFAWDQLNAAIWPFFEKWTMEPGRMILFAVWMLTAYVLVSKHERAIRRWTFGILDTLGQNSLFVYGVHAIVIFIIHLFLPAKDNLYFNFTVTAMALLVIVGLTYAKETITLSHPEKILLSSQLVFRYKEVE